MTSSGLLFRLIVVLIAVIIEREVIAQNKKTPEMAIRKNDINGDGKVSKAEWKKSSTIFDSIDLNKDGFLTRKEFEIKFSGKPSVRTVERSQQPVISAVSPEMSKVSESDYGEWYGDDTFWQGPIFDVHSQVDEKTDLNTLVPLMNKAGVSQIFVSTRFSQPTSDLLQLAARYPQRILPAAKTKTKAFMKGGMSYPDDFYQEQTLYDFKAMAEIIMWHAAKVGVGAGKATMDPDDQRLLHITKTAHRKGWPFIAHIEFAAMGSEKTRYMNKFKQFLADNSDLKVGLIHMGQLNHSDVAELLAEFPNLFFITSHCNPITGQNSSLPWTKMFYGGAFKPEWKSLILQYPDRFVLGIDNVFYFHWQRKFMPQIMFWRKALNTLPDDIAHAFAHKNAVRLWNLDPVKLPHLY